MILTDINWQNVNYGFWQTSCFGIAPPLPRLSKKFGKCAGNKSIWLIRVRKEGALAEGESFFCKKRVCQKTAFATSVGSVSGF